MVAGTKTGQNPYELQKELSNVVRNGGFSVGFTLFPNETFPRNIGYGAWNEGVNITAEQIKEALAYTNVGSVLLYIVGFIDYTFPADKSAHHQTGFVVELRKKDFTLPMPNEGFIPASELVLVDAPMGMGHYAD